MKKEKHHVARFPFLSCEFFLISQLQGIRPCLRFNSSWSFKQKKNPKLKRSLGEVDQECL
jgi:hypothetical protein